MDALLIVSLVLVSAVYTASHHLFNWGIRKVNIMSDDNLPVLLAFGYIVINILYWIYLVQMFKLILHP